MVADPKFRKVTIFSGSPPAAANFRAKTSGDYVDSAFWGNHGAIRIA